MNTKVTKMLCIILVIFIIIAGALIVKEIFIEEDDEKQLEALKQNEVSQTAVSRNYREGRR